MSKKILIKTMKEVAEKVKERQQKLIEKGDKENEATQFRREFEKEKMERPWKNNKPLTDEEVQRLREKAKEYAKEGGKYLEGGEFKQLKQDK
jgi:hypothetical protein